VAETVQDSTNAEDAAKRRKKVRRIIGVVVSLVLVVGIFVYAIPKFADYSSVWAAVTTLTPFEFSSLFAATLFNLVTYWLANMAALPGLRLWPAAVLTQTTTSVANTLPGGGAIAVGLTYQMLRSWGFTGTDVALYVGVTGIWNIFTKLGLPVASIAILAVTGRSSSAYIVAAVFGVAALAGSAGLLAGVFASERLARRIGAGLGRVISWVTKPFGRAPMADGGDRVAKFRHDTIGLVERRWLRISGTTILSQLALYFVLLLSLRHMGVSELDVGAAEIFAVFAFSRLLTALPLTPGGVGVIDLGYIGGLVAVGGDADRAPIVAAVLLFRVLTYGIQIPIGGFTYLIWRAKTQWRAQPGGIPSGGTPEVSSGA
jgi:putative heme transporter